MKSFLPSSPPNINETLFLICEELKSRKLQHALRKSGIDDCYFLPNLDWLILRNLGLDEEDETFRTYNIILEKRSRKIKTDHDSIA